MCMCARAQAMGRYGDRYGVIVRSYAEIQDVVYHLNRFMALRESGEEME